MKYKWLSSIKFYDTKEEVFGDLWFKYKIRNVISKYNHRKEGVIYPIRRPVDDGVRYAFTGK